GAREISAERERANAVSALRLFQTNRESVRAERPKCARVQRQTSLDHLASMRGDGGGRPAVAVPVSSRLLSAGDPSDAGIGYALWHAAQRECLRRLRWCG